MPIRPAPTADLLLFLLLSPPPLCSSPHLSPSSLLSSDGEDGLYLDAADRARLEAMTELDREMILSDRAEERDKLRQRKALLKSAKGAADKVGGWGTSCGRGRPCLRVQRGQQTRWGGGGQAAAEEGAAQEC